MFFVRPEFRMFSKTAFAGVVAKLVLCSMPAHLSASIIYTNISSAFPGTSVSSQFEVTDGFAGTTFITTGSGNLSSIVTDLSQPSGSAPLTVGLYTDAYSAPGALLESWVVPVIPTCCGSVPASVPPLTTLVSVLHPQLSSGTKYWFVVSLGSDNSVYWWFNDQGVTGGVWTHNTIAPLYEGNTNLPTPGIQLNSDQPQPPSRTGVLSQIAAGGGWSTVITLVNTSSAAVPVIVELHADNGSALTLPVTTTQQGVSQTSTAASVNATLNPNSTLLVSMGDQVTSTVVGWADVLSTGPIGGYAIFRWTPQTGSPSEGTVPLQSQFPSTITLPYDNTAGFVMGVALANLSTASAGVTATMWDENGNQLGMQTIEIAGSGHTSFVMPTQFPQTAGKLGIVTFQSTGTGGIAALGLRFSPFGTFTSVPAILGQ
jgi:hypothetical protein